MIETRPLLSMFLTALLVVTMSGCDTFDNPLRWEQSPIADDLIGTWKEAEGNAGLQAKVSRTDDKTLGFEVTSPEERRTTFLGNVINAGSVHVLQVRMDSYKEFDNDGESSADPATGFYFLRIAPSPPNRVKVHDLDVDTMGRVAERELAASDLTIAEEAYARCLRDSIRDRIWKKALLAGLLSEQEAEAIQRQSAKSPEAGIDPYPDMARLRTCVAHRLPSESLEQLFLEHADEVFSGETSVFVRE
ncbi:MAG: hypothetical protein OXH52_22355 [Gammaproteobacteria bacterium]|nr:hypothetical protein [Gammaproteobacteria bacterium]